MKITRQFLKYAFVSVFCMTAMLATAQEYTAENEGWLVNLEEAYDLSKETGKPILANFTGSDWCGWCKKLTSSVFAKEEFQTWAEDEVILLEIDFPRRKQLPAEIQQQNAGLQQAFQVKGYPSVWLFDLEKDETGRFSIEAYGKTGYRATVKEFTTDIAQMKAKKKNG